MRDKVIFICLCLYTLLLVYAGFFAQYRDVEDLCNQASHIVICIAVAAVYWLPTADARLSRVNKYFSFILVVLNIAEVVDEFRRGNYKELSGNDYIFPLLTILIPLSILWITSREK